MGGVKEMFTSRVHHTCISAQKKCSESSNNLIHKSADAPSIASAFIHELQRNRNLEQLITAILICTVQLQPRKSLQGSNQPRDHPKWHQ